jgi:DNA-binding CsgD family transcriptional regulator/PAS domain-containing protein
MLPADCRRPGIRVIAMLSLDEFSELVGHIYDGAFDQALWPSILQRLVHATGAAGGALLTSDFSRRELQAVHVGFDPAARLSYDQYYGGLDPVAPVLERSVPGSIVLSHCIVAPSEQGKTEFYPDWAHPTGFGLTAFATLVRDERAVSTLCLCGPLRVGKQFDAVEIANLLRHVTPHLRRALQMSAATQAKEIERQGLRAALAQIRHAAVMLDTSRKVVFVNDAAEGIVGQADGLTIAQGHLCATHPVQNSALQRLITVAIGRGRDGLRGGGTIAISRLLSPTPLAVHVTPLRDTHPSAVGAKHVVVCIVDPAREAQLRPAHLQQLYGLTTAEAEVAVRVVRGHKLQSVADDLSVTLSTVRIHLQRVFEKTHTHRQAQLVRLLLGVANVFDGTADATGSITRGEVR